MSWLSSITGRDAARNAQHSADQANAAVGAQVPGLQAQQQQLWNGVTGAGPMVGQDAFTQSFQSAMASAMPQFLQQLQGTRESANRRGISTGDLGTTYEGDLASAFQRNTANAAAGQAMNLFQTNLGAAQGQQNTLLDLLTGQRDAAQGQANAQRQRQGNLLGGLGSLAGGGLGAFFGGSKGAQVGSMIGGSLLGGFA